MNDNGSNSKLDWMYKGANSLVDREEYLLGRSVDKTLDQLNAEEKEKKLGIVPPKNHVEHECIPPSIRDFNKIVQAEQVDISAKLQEDPLVAIKKQEEEARRQFLQNPVQLKKLQEALKAQELKKKKSKHKKSKQDSDSDLDSKIAKKLMYLKNDSVGLPVSKKRRKKPEDSALDTILMHKFNELKDKLSQEDLNDILAGKISDSDEETEKKEKKHKKRKNSSSDESDHKQNKSKGRERRRKRSSEKNVKTPANKLKDSSSDSSCEDERYKRNHRKGPAVNYKGRDKSQRNYEVNCTSRNKSFDRKPQTYSSSEDSGKDEIREIVDTEYRKKSLDKKKGGLEHSKEINLNGDKVSQKIVPDDDLENRILEKLRFLRNSSKSKRSESSSDSEKGTKCSNTSDSEKGDTQGHRYDSDGEEREPKSRTFGLVKADGTKIAFSGKPHEVKKSNVTGKVETVTKQDRKNVKRLTEAEKDQLRKEMMKNAEKRDKERSENLKRYREEDKREEKSASNFDKDFLHKQLVRSTKEATVESRIKSNLNNIQRSSRHMDTHFSRR